MYDEQALNRILRNKLFLRVSVPLCSMKSVSTRQLGVNAEFIIYLCLPSGFFRLFQHFLHAA